MRREAAGGEEDAAVGDDDDDEDDDDESEFLMSAGPKTLCNACGVKRQRVKRMRQQEAERMQQATASRHDHGQRGPWQMRIQEVPLC